MSKPISQLDDVVNLSQFIVPGIEGAGPFTNAKGKLVAYFVPKTGGAFTGPVTIGGANVITEAPNDGQQYARKNTAWAPVNIPAQDWSTITGKPSTFPPTLPIPASGVSGSINDAQHGNLSGGSLHALASGAVAGFMAAADKAKLDGISAGATVGIPEAPTDGQQYARKSAAWAVVAQPPPATSIGDNPPASPVHGQQWWKSDTGNMFIYYNDGNTSQWVQVNIPAQVLNDYVSKAGDTMTGDLAISKSNPVFKMDRPAAQNTYIGGYTAGTVRWLLNMASSDAESGGNAGSNFRIERYSDAGAFIDTPLSIGRVNGWLTTVAPLQQTPASGAATMYLDKGVGAVTNSIFGRVQTAVPAKTRWGLELGDGVAESGGNVGSRFKINRYDDNGSYIDTPLFIDRDTGIIHLGVGNIHWATRTPSTDAWTLDDYREGTWVPSLGGTATYTSQIGRYQKVGNRVHIEGVLAINAIGTGDVINISGLPFVASQSTAISVGYFNTLNKAVTWVGALVGGGTTTINFYYLTAAATGVVNTSIFGSGTSIYFAGSYTTAS